MYISNNYQPYQPHDWKWFLSISLQVVCLLLWCIMANKKANFYKSQKQKAIKRQSNNNQIKSIGSQRQNVSLGKNQSVYCKCQSQTPKQQGAYRYI